MRTSARRPQAERREQIAAAALRLLGRGGLEAVTAAALAREVGVTPGALFRHFATLDDVIVAAVHQAAARLDACLPPVSADPAEGLRRLALDRVALLREEPGIAWLLRSEEAPSALPPAAVSRLRAAIRSSRARIHEGIRLAVAQGDVRADVPVPVLLALFTAAVHALAGPFGLSHRSARRADPTAVLDGLFTVLGVPRPETSR
jgi:AcrR family transcriptional regulator